MTKHLVVLLSLLASTARAAEAPRVCARVSGGLAVPAHPAEFEKGWAPGAGAGIAMGFRPSPRLSVFLAADFARFKLDEQGFLQDLDETVGIDPDITIGVEGGSTTSLSAGIQAQLALHSSGGGPYLIGGLEVSRIRVSSLEITVAGFGVRGEDTLPGEAQTVAGAVVGAGWELPLASKLGLFLEGVYRVAFISDDPTGHAVVKVGLQIGR